MSLTRNTEPNKATAEVDPVNDEELWNLDVEIARFLAARITAFHARSYGHPGGLTPETWDAILVEMHEGFYDYANTDVGCFADPEGHAAVMAKVKRSCDLLAEWLPGLWW